MVFRRFRRGSKDDDEEEKVVDNRPDDIIQLDNRLMEFFEFLDDVADNHDQLRQAVYEYDQYQLSPPKEDIKTLVPELHDQWKDVRTTASELQTEMEETFGDPTSPTQPPEVWKVYEDVAFYAELSTHRVPEFGRAARMVENDIEGYVEYRIQQYESNDTAFTG